MSKSDFLWLLARHFSGEISAEESSVLREVMEENPAYREKYVYINRYFQQKKASSPDLVGKFEEVWNTILHREQEPAMSMSGFEKEYAGKEAPVRQLFGWWRLAAGVFLLAVLTSVLFYIFQDHAKMQEASVITVSNPNSFRTYLKLPDGTIVWVNKNSQVSYSKDFGKGKRELQLIGEAYFDVVHNPQMPMVVHAGELDVVVRGTVFDLKAYPHEPTITASLLKGKIEMVDRSRREQVLVLRPNDKVVIEKRSISAEDSLKKTVPVGSDHHFAYKVERIDLQNKEIRNTEFSWMNDELVFNNMPLEDVLFKLGRRYNRVIKSEDPDLLKLTYTGVFRGENFEEALDALCLSSNLLFKKQNDEVIIYTH